MGGMDNNEYRTQLIVKAYHCAEGKNHIQNACEGWELFVDQEMLKIDQFEELILSVENGDTFLSPTINLQNCIPHFVIIWIKS